jgi:GT2 family glycosyltransferase
MERKSYYFNVLEMVYMNSILPFVSVIVLNYNGRAFLSECLPSIFKISYPKSSYEVILVDNGSADGSVEYVKEKFPSVRILALKDNHGYAGGNNRGAAFARGEFVAFLNNDTIVDAEWLGELVKVIRRDRRAAICGSKVVLMDRQNHVQYSGAFLNPLGGPLFYPFHGLESSRDFYVVGSICGASFLISKMVFSTIGGFDESYFMYSEEVDLCLRAWICGHHVLYASNSVVYHFGRGSQAFEGDSRLVSSLEARLASPLTLYHGNKNSMASLVKNFQLETLFIGALLSLLYGAVQLILLLKRRAPTGAIFLIRGYFWPIRNFPKLWRKRLLIRNMRRTNDVELIRVGVLLSARRMIKIVMSQVF